MKKALKISIYLLGIFLVLSGIGLGQIGALVTMTDPSLGLALTPLPQVAPAVNPFVFFDVNGNSGYDAADPVYLTSSGIQTRMNFLPAPFSAGTKVVWPNLDLFAPLTFAPAPNFDPAIVYVPKYGSSAAYVQGDPIYLAMTPAPNDDIQTNDIRLTPQGILKAGTKVTDSQPDWGNAWLPVPSTWSLQYADVNGNSAYDAADHVFLHISTAPVVGLGDLHLD